MENVMEESDQSGINIELNKMSFDLNKEVHSIDGQSFGNADISAEQLYWNNADLLDLNNFNNFLE